MPLRVDSSLRLNLRWVSWLRSDEPLLLLLDDGPCYALRGPRLERHMTVQRDYEQYLSRLNSAKFRTLFPHQAAVLKDYSANFTGKKDVAVELPTGAGKTPIALLIAGAWLEEGKKVAVLSANKTLARQMASEARELGIPFAHMEGRGQDLPAKDRRAYQRAQAIGIMNYWVYLNQNPVIDPADLLVMDDAHLAEHCLHSLYSVEVTKFNHNELFTALVTELQAQFPDYGVLRDALSDDAPPSSTAELMSFIDQDAAADRIREQLDAYANSKGADVDLKFRWQRLRPKLRDVNLYVSRHALWLRPYVYPLVSNPHYADVSQVLYMSATIGDPGDLARRLGTRPIKKIPIDPKQGETTSGRRLIVMNRTSEEGKIPERMAAALLEALRLHPKSLWLCNSDADARKWKEVVTKWLSTSSMEGHPTWLLTSLGDEVDQFRRAASGHLFVAGRFDGMDFKDDECRIVVITTLPRAINLQEEFITSYLRDAGFMRRRLNQRIVQALGRCNRAPEDYGVYFLADQRFATHFSAEANREGLSANIQAEIDLAQDVAEMADGEVATRVTQFLQRDFVLYDAELAERTDGVPGPRPAQPMTDTSADEVLGWAALDSQNYPVAAVKFEACWEVAKADNAREFGALHGWHRAKALYLQGSLGDAGARERGLQALDDAITRGGRSSWFNRMRASLLRARADATAARVVVESEYAEALIRTFDDFLENVGTVGGKYQRHIDRITNMLSSDKHPQYQEGLECFGGLLAYTATRPKYGTATDCRWRGEFGAARELFTFEAKIEHAPSNTVTATDLGQAHNQLARAETEFSVRGYTVRGTVVTHLHDIHADAVSSVGTLKVLPKDAVLELWRMVSAILSSYRAGWSLDDVGVRAQAAAAIRPRLPRTGWLTRALERGTPYVEAAALRAEWDS